jgi:hypothetical protein
MKRVSKDASLKVIKASAYRERKKAKDVVNEALGSNLKGKRIKCKKSEWLRSHI